MSTLRILTPLDIGHGISPLPAESQRYFTDHIPPHVGYFIPASGKATRMFSSLQHALLEDASSGAFLQHPDVQAVLAHRDQLPFMVDERDPKAYIAELLTTYAPLPKALLPWHVYPDGVRLCFQEHIAEFLALLPTDFVLSHKVQVRFSVNKSFQRLLNKALDSYKLVLEKRLSTAITWGESIKLATTVQDPSTDLPVYHAKENTYVYDTDGRPLLHPSGHGSLLPILQQMANQGVELLFIKNVDNVQHTHCREQFVHGVWQSIGGRLLALVSEVHEAIHALQTHREGAIATSYALLEGSFGQRELPRFEGDLVLQRKFLMQRLWRPLRVCGVQKADSFAGGAPFLCEDIGGGSQSPQLVECAQVMGTPQEALFKQSKFVNCAMLACYVQDPEHQPFELSRFVDARTRFKTDKIVQDTPVRVQERPGLWNGSMSGWNSAFVSIPAASFAPVKTAMDLLNPSHQPPR